MFWQPCNESVEDSLPVGGHLGVRVGAAVLLVPIVGDQGPNTKFTKYKARGV